MTRFLYNIVFIELLLFSSFSILAQDTLTMGQLRDSMAFYKTSNPEKYLLFSNSLEDKFAKNKNDIEELIKLKISIANQLIYQNAFDLAINKTQEAIILSDLKKDDKLKADAYKTLGNIYYQKESYISAIKYYSVSDSLANDKFHSLKIRFNYSGIKQRIGNYEEALEIKLQLFKDLETLHNGNAKSINIENVLNIINIYKTLLKKNPAKRKEYLKGIEKYSQIFLDYKIDNEVSKIIFELTQLSIGLDNNFSKNIIIKYDSLQNALWKNNIHFSDRMIFYYKAKCYYRLNDPENSLRLLKKIDSIEKKMPNGLLYRDEIDILYSKVYHALGENDLALQKMEAANTILNNKERQRKEVSKVLQNYYDYYAINKNIRALENPDINKKSSFQYGWFILLGLVLTALYFIARKRKKENNIDFENNLSEEINIEERLVEENDLQEAKDEIIADTIKENDNKEKTSGEIIISKDVVEESLLKLKQYEKTKLYLSGQTDLKSLANFIGQNRVYTSIILNDYLNTSFKDYINRLRINYAIKKINESESFRNLSIETISEQLGYKTANTFTKSFKLITGFTPYKYIMRVKKTLKKLK